MKKKLLALLLVGTMALSMVACGNDQDSQASDDKETSNTEESESDAADEQEAEAETETGEKLELTFVNPYYNTEVLEACIEEYNQMQDKVVVKRADATFSGVEEYFEQLGVNMASGEDAYDMFIISSAYFNKYVTSGVSYCLDDQIPTDDIKDYALEAITRDGHIYSYPAANDVIGMYVNVDMVEGTGHTLDELKTWDSFLTVCEDIAAEYGVYGCTTNRAFGGGYAEFLWYSVMWSAGGDISSDMEGNITVTNPEKVAEAAKAYRDLIMGAGGSNDLDNPLENVSNGLAAMDIMGQEGLYLYDEWETDVNWTWVPIPAVSEEEGSYSTLGGWFTMINAQKDQERIDASKEFLNWLFFESDFMAENCMANYQLSPLYSADEKMDALYVDTKYSIPYAAIEAGDVTCRAELAFDSQTLQSLGEMLSGVIYETSTDEEVMAKVQGFIDAVGATTE